MATSITGQQNNNRRLLYVTDRTTNQRRSQYIQRLRKIEIQRNIQLR